MKSGTGAKMILSVTFSRPVKNCSDILGRRYERVRMWKASDSGLKVKAGYEADFFTSTQSFRKNLSEDEALDFIKKHSGTTFRTAVQRTEDEEITVLSNRHGEIRTLRKKIRNPVAASGRFSKEKNYIIQEGNPVPFLVELGVMSKEGKVIAAKYDKFRQINRFLEYIRDVLPDLKKLCAGQNGSEAFSKERPLRIVDFGCGKSYLTFALYYYLLDCEKIPVEITGLDLKEDVIKNCASLAEKLGCTGLHFYIGNASDFSKEENPDMIVTLHACDTATDFALNHALRCSSKVILSVPCCQHEINLQIEKNGKSSNENPFASFTRYGLIRERFSALATDAIRAEILEQAGYSVQLLEFIDMEHTPKNLLIRAVKKSCGNSKSISDKIRVEEESRKRVENLLSNLGVEQTLSNLRCSK